MAISFHQDYDYLFKVLLIGNSSVGKSSILLRFTDNTFNENFLPTIGVDFKIKTFTHEGRTAKLQIWDTAGQERFKTITTTYYKGAHGIMLVYDVTDRQSFKDIDTWVQEVQRHASENVITILVGNKCDMTNREVSTQEGEDYAKALGIKFVETSAKAGQNIDKVFGTLANEIKSHVGNSTENSIDGKGPGGDLNGDRERANQQLKGKKKPVKSGCC